MWFKKLKSAEYLELKGDYERLRIQFKALELDLQLYTKKLKASKGVKELKEPEEEQDLYNGILLKE